MLLPVDAITKPAIACELFIRLAAGLVVFKFDGGTRKVGVTMVVPPLPFGFTTNSLLIKFGFDLLRCIIDDLLTELFKFNDEDWSQLFFFFYFIVHIKKNKLIIFKITTEDKVGWWWTVRVDDDELANCIVSSIFDKLINESSICLNWLPNVLSSICLFNFDLSLSNEDSKLNWKKNV